MDEELHQSRTVLYRELWRETSILPKWPRATGVTYARLAELSAWLRDWYFGVREHDGERGLDGERVPGGLYLSLPARKRYEKVQDSLADLTGEGPISSTDYDSVRGALSELRKQMTRDLLSRRGAPFRLI